MEQKDAFSSCHPAGTFLFFILVTFLPMFCMDPPSLAVSLVCSLSYAAVLKGWRAVMGQARFLLPLVLLAGLINLLLNSRGSTVLFSLPWGRDLTLESALYGAVAALAVLAAIEWFFCFSTVMTADKLMCLFEKKAPSLGLVLVLALGFVPRFRRRLEEIRQAQRPLGRDMSQGGPVRRLKCAVDMLSILVTWALEDAMSTASGMRSRGYGLPGRTAFSPYRFCGRDRALLAWTAACGLFLIWGWAGGVFSWEWYPSIQPPAFTGSGLALRIVYCALCLTPLALRLRDSFLWAGTAGKGENL